jgi:thiamine pyrophosphokinase
MRAIIVCDGTVNEDSSFYKSFFKDDDFIVCADGGVRNAFKLDLKPDIIIGDMDSAPEELLNNYEHVLVEEQETTDSEKAITYALDKGYHDIILIGATGTRMDHSVNNIFLLEKYSSSKIRLVDEHNDIHLASSEERLSCKVGDVISLIPLTKVEGLRMDGLKYDAHTLDRSTVGVHNEATKTEVIIAHSKGVLLIDRIC